MKRDEINFTPDFDHSGDPAFMENFIGAQRGIIGKEAGEEGDILTYLKRNAVPLRIFLSDLAPELQEDFKKAAESSDPAALAHLLSEYQPFREDFEKFIATLALEDQEAADAFTNALELAPTDPDAQENVRRIATKLKNLHVPTPDVEEPVA